MTGARCTAEHHPLLHPWCHLMGRMCTVALEMVLVLGKAGGVAGDADGEGGTACAVDGNGTGANDEMGWMVVMAGRAAVLRMVQSSMRLLVMLRTLLMMPRMLMLVAMARLAAAADADDGLNGDDGGDDVAMAMLVVVCEGDANGGEAEDGNAGGRADEGDDDAVLKATVTTLLLLNGVQRLATLIEAEVGGYHNARTITVKGAHRAKSSDLY